MEANAVFDYYILFPNHHEGLHLHKELKKAGVKCRIAPTPREASSFCGISLLVTEENLDSAKKVIDSCGVKIEGIARIRRKY
ncbi:MAG: DUF3343 domain-containing protein [Thermacetogeniaceae bacterium]